MDISSRFTAVARFLRRAKTARFWVTISMAASAALAVTIAAIRLDQALLRRDAESLLQDVSTLKVGVTTDIEVRQLMERWPRDSESSRASEANGVGVVLKSFATRHGDFVFRHPRLLSLCLMLGFRPSQVRAAFGFSGGVLSYKSVGVYINQPEYGLIAGVTFMSSENLESEPHFVGNKFHPTYSVSPGGGCERCMRIEVRFLPGVDSADVNRLMELNLSCLNRWWRPCTQADLMPAGWKQYLEDEGGR